MHRSTRYALKNASKHLNVFKYVDPGSAAKEALDFGKNKLGYLSVALDTLSGVVENVGEGASVQETIVDGAVDTTAGVGVIATSAAMGVAIGSVVPVYGNIAGAAVGLAVGFGLDYFLNVGDESIKDKVKTKANEFVDNGISWVKDKFF